jgi:Domain of unknown function (DUF4386)
MNTNRNTASITNVSPERAPMNAIRKTSLVAGLCYLLTFISIPTLTLYGSIHEPNYILGHGPDHAVIFGGMLEIVVALACIGTAVVLYPMLKKQNEGIALGFVASRILEACTIFAGVAFLLSVVTLRQDGAGVDSLSTSRALVALYDRIFLLGQSFLPAVNALLVGYLLYKARLVPRVLPLIGFFGAALLIAADIAVMFGLVGQRAASTSLAAIPIAFWELSLGIYLLVKGLKPLPSKLPTNRRRTLTEPPPIITTA